MINHMHCIKYGIIFILFCVGLNGKTTIDLTLHSAVEIAMNKSYRVKQLKMGIEHTRSWLKAEQAGLKSKVYMHVKAPEYKFISEYKWNSEIQKDELVRQNTSLWQMDLSIRQPVILLGYPTNGYLSLNNRTYKYIQKDGYDDISYYNRFFIKYEQPFFRPNTLRNAIENAELNLKEQELEFIDDLVDLIDDVADDYYDLFELVYKNQIYKNQLGLLSEIQDVVEIKKSVDNNKTSSLELNQIKVKIANTKERILQYQGDLRIEIADMKQRLRLDEETELNVSTEVALHEITIDVEDAINKGYTLGPDLQLLSIRKRRDEISLANTRGWNAFNVNLEVTYGLERQSDDYRQIWNDNDNSYSASVNAYIPLWDWGQQKNYIEARKISIRRTELYQEERQSGIKSAIVNSVESLKEYQKRALNMRESMAMARDNAYISLDEYQKGTITVRDLLANVDALIETENNFLDAYLGYRRSLLKLMIHTYYDYENNQPVLDQYLVTSTN